MTNLKKRERAKTNASLISMVQRFSDIKLLGENESIYIPLGATHCLENPGKIPLDLIEVRSGSYLEEDDVVRFADRYGRV